MDLYTEKKQTTVEVLLPLGLTEPQALALIGEARKELLSYWSIAGRLDDDSLFSLTLAYEELASNVARHSLARSTTDIRMQCEASLDNSILRLAIRDNGPPFNPLAGSGIGTEVRYQNIPVRIGDRVGGMGLRIVRGLFTNLAYEYAGGWNKVQISMPCQKQ